MNALAQIIHEADIINVDRARYTSHTTYQRWMETERGTDYLTHVMAFRDYVRLDNVIKGIAVH